MSKESKQEKKEKARRFEAIEAHAPRAKRQAREQARYATIAEIRRFVGTPSERPDWVIEMHDEPRYTGRGEAIFTASPPGAAPVEIVTGIESPEQLEQLPPDADADQAEEGSPDLHDWTAEEEARLVGETAPYAEPKRRRIAAWRERQARGDDEPRWGEWSEFRVTLADGRPVAVRYDPRTTSGVGHLDMHGPMTSTGYRSHHMTPRERDTLAGGKDYTPRDAKPGETLAQYAERFARECAAENAKEQAQAEKRARREAKKAEKEAKAQAPTAKEQAHQEPDPAIAPLEEMLEAEAEADEQTRQEEEAEGHDRTRCYSCKEGKGRGTCPASIACPDCGARPGAQCRRPSGHTCDMHTARFRKTEQADGERCPGFEPIETKNGTGCRLCSGLPEDHPRLARPKEEPAPEPKRWTLTVLPGHYDAGKQLPEIEAESVEEAGAIALRKYYPTYWPGTLELMPVRGPKERRAKKRDEERRLEGARALCKAYDNMLAGNPALHREVMSPVPDPDADQAEEKQAPADTADARRKWIVMYNSEAGRSEPLDFLIGTLEEAAEEAVRHFDAFEADRLSLYPSAIDNEELGRDGRKELEHRSKKAIRDAANLAGA